MNFHSRKGQKTKIRQICVTNLQDNAGQAFLISDAGGWDLDGLDEGDWVVVELEWLLTGLLQHALGISVVTWHAGVTDLLWRLVLRLESTAALGNWLHGEADAVYLVVIVSAKSAELVLARLGWELGLDGVSVKTDLSLWKLDDDSRLSELLNLVLGVVLRADLLSVDLDADLVLLELSNNLLLSADNLEGHLLGVLLSLLGEDGEGWLLGAVLGEKGEAGGEWGLVEDVIEGADLVLLDLADWAGNFGELGLDRALGDGWKVKLWNLSVHELNTLLWGLDGDVNELTGQRLDGELEDDAVLLVGLWAGRDGPEVVGLEKVEVTAHGLLGLLVELVLGNSGELVQTGGLDEELVFWHSIELTLHVALVLLLFLGLLDLGVDGHLVFLLGTPVGGESNLHLAVWLFTELAEGRWHFWADGNNLGTESPFLGLLKDWGAADLNLPLAHTGLLVADGSNLSVHVVVTWSLELEGDQVLDSLLLLDLLDHLGEVLAAALSVLLRLNLVLEKLLRLDLGKLGLLELGESETGGELGWAFLVLDGDLDVLLGKKPVLKSPLVQDVSAGGNLESEELVDLLNFLGLLLPLWDNDGSLLSLDVLEVGESWVAKEDNWAGREGDDRLLVLWDDDLVNDLKVSLHSSDGLDLDWGESTDGLKALDSLLEEWGEHSHLVDVGGGNRWASLNGHADFGSVHLEGETSLSREDSWDLSRNGKWESKSSWELADGLVEVSSLVRLELMVLVENATDGAKLNLSVSSDELLNHSLDDLSVEWEDGVVHILVAKVDHGEGFLLVLGGWAGTDVHLLGEFLEELDSGLDAASANNSGGLLLENLELLESLPDVLVHVLLGESHLGEVLVPVSSENGVEGSMEVLWQERVLLEDGGEIELSSGEGVLGEEWKLGVAGSDHLLLWLEAGEGEDLGAIRSATLVAWVGRLGKVLDHLVGEGGNLLVGLLLHLRDNLDEDWLLWLGVHHSPESEHAELWLILTVLVDWEENLLDLAWHVVSEKSESINSLLADWEWLALVNNDLVELVDGDIKSSVSDGLEGQNLLVSGLGVVELLHEDLEELLLVFALVLANKWSDVLVVNDSADDRSCGKPGGLVDDLVGLGNAGLGKLDERLSNAHGWVWGLLDRLEKLGSLNWGDVLVLDVVQKVLDGVLGSGNGESVLNHGADLLHVEGLVDLLKLGSSGGAEDADKTGEEVSGLWHVVLDLLDLLGNGLDQLDLLVKWELLEWRELGLVSVLEEVLNKLLPAGRVDDVFLFPHLLDLVLDGVNLLKDDLRAGLSLHDFLSVDADGVEGADLRLLEDILLKSVGVDGLWADDLGLLVALWALRRVAESIGGLGTLGALVEVDRLGDDGVLLLANNGVGNLAVSLKSLLVGEERGVLLLSWLLLVVAVLHLLHLVSWGDWVEGDHVENGSLHVLGPLSILLIKLELRDESISELGTDWELEHLLVLVRELTLLHGVQGWHLLGFRKVRGSHADVDELEVDIAVIDGLNTGTGRNTGLRELRGSSWKSREDESIKFVVVLGL